jgi:hypothetical protein
MCLFTPARAQEPEGEPFPIINWQEMETRHFIIVYAENIEGVPNTECACGIENAQYYANFIDQIYEDFVAVFGAELETPINLRLFPTQESYYQINPLAEQIPGVVAHALNSREEIAIALPRTQQLSDEEIENNMRHELAHFFASLLSDGKLNAGFQEGIAQYLEKPNVLTQQSAGSLESAYNNNLLLTWAELDEAEEVFGDSDVAYPQTVSIVAFLVDRYGFPTFIEFMKANATEPGYRSALEVAYQRPADLLEVEWLEYLPEYFAGRWQVNSIYAYDLSRVSQLVERGAYSDAEAELLEVIQLLEKTHQDQTLTQAKSLLDRARQGQAAGALANEARDALVAGDYPLTISKANDAIMAYEALGYIERIPEIQIYIQRAQLGLKAIEQLDYGQELMRSLRFFEAERQMHNATVLLQSLDNQAQAQRGKDLLAKSAYRQSIIAYALLLVGLLLLFFIVLRRIMRHLSLGPLEVEFR